MDDKELASLVRAIQGGSEAAFEQLFERFAQKLCAQPA